MILIERDQNNFGSDKHKKSKKKKIAKFNILVTEFTAHVTAVVST